jgi:cardiolipin synthase
MSTIATIVITLLSTALLVVLGINLATAEKRLLYRPRRLYTTRDADFRRALGVLLGPPLVAGNEVTTLINGAEIFPAMLDAIHAAEVSITFETFVFRDEIGKRFCKALTSAARRGVHVHVLLDWLGSRTMPPTMLSAIRDAGADVQLYHAPSWYHLGRLNNRTHRKLMIIDGKTGFTA